MSLSVSNTSINYTETSIITVTGLTNVTITPYIYIIDITVLGDTTSITVQPEVSTLYFINNILNTTIYVKVTSEKVINIDYNQNVTLNAYGSVSYTWYPSKYLNITNSSSVICTPLENIIYTITGLDSFNTITKTYLAVNVNSNLIINPLNPSVYSGNLLILHVNYNNATSYTWQEQPVGKCMTTIHGELLELHPYNNKEYSVTAYNNNNILTNGNIKINVILKPSNIIDIDILPYQWYKLILSKNRNALLNLVRKNKILSHKIIYFYYIILLTAYRMEWTNKNGNSYKINWITLYQIVNKSDGMILNFEQLWRFFQYIRTPNSHFYYLLNIVNEVYLEHVQKIAIYPLGN